MRVKYFPCSNQNFRPVPICIGHSNLKSMQSVLQLAFYKQFQSKLIINLSSYLRHVLSSLRAQSGFPFQSLFLETLLPLDSLQFDDALLCLFRIKVVHKTFLI